MKKISKRSGIKQLNKAVNMRVNVFPHLLRRIASVHLLIIAFAMSLVLPAEAEETGVELAEDGSWGYAGHHAHIARNTLFYSYLDTEGDLWLASYDFETGQFNRNSIWNVGADLHAAHPLIIRPDGRIQVFVAKGGYHDKRIRWKVSAEPYSIEKFGELQKSEREGDIIQGRQFYPMLHRASGNMYLVTNARRNGGREAVMWKSEDGGDTWNEYHNLWGLGKGLSGNRCYTRAFIECDQIHLVTLRIGWGEQLNGHGIGRSEGVYYVRYDVKERTFFRADGSKAFDFSDTPVYDTEYFDEVWHWQKDGDGQHRALWTDIVAKDGRPYITCAVQKAVPRGEESPHYGYWAAPDDDGVWGSLKVGRLAPGWDNMPRRKNYSIALDPDSPDTVFAAICTGEEEGLSQVHRMQTPDDGEKWESANILSGESRISTVVVPRRIDDTPRKYNALWLDGRMDGWGTYDTSIKTRRLTE